MQLFTLYNAHLDAAHAFYQHLLFQIKEKFDLPIPNLLDWLDNFDSSKRKNEGIGILKFFYICKWLIAGDIF